MPKALRRNYNLSDGELIELADSMLAAAQRDAENLEKYGHDAAAQAVLQDLRDGFADIPSDEFYSGEMQIATADKNDKMVAMKKAAEDIVQRAILKWGKASPYVRQFGFEGYAAKREADKVQVCRLVYTTGTARLADMEGVGLRQTILDDLKAKIDAADVAITTKRTKVSDRDIKTHERIEQGNALYESLRKLADTGKHIWEDENEAKYNDYVIYRSTPPAGEVVSGNPAPEAVHAPAVNFDSPENGIEFSNTGSTALVIYFADDPETEPSAGATTVAPGSDWSGTAGGLGYSPQNFRFLIKNNDAEQTGAFTMVVVE